MPIVLEGLIPLIAIIVIASSLTTIAKAFITSRARQGGTPLAQLRRVEELMTELQDDVRLLRDDVAELNERVDFAERLLARGRDESGLLGERKTP